MLWLSLETLISCQVPMNTRNPHPTSYAGASVKATVWQDMVQPCTGCKKKTQPPKKSYISKGKSMLKSLKNSLFTDLNDGGCASFLFYVPVLICPLLQFHKAETTTNNRFPGEKTRTSYFLGRQNWRVMLKITWAAPRRLLTNNSWGYQNRLQKAAPTQLLKSLWNGSPEIFLESPSTECNEASLNWEDTSLDLRAEKVTYIFLSQQLPTKCVH